MAMEGFLMTIPITDTLDQGIATTLACLLIINLFLNHKDPKSAHRTLVVALPIIIILLSLLFYIEWTSHQQQQTRIDIQYPMHDAFVQEEETVIGTSQYLPRNHAIWIVLHPHHVGRYYPQEAPVEMQPNGDWSSRIYIGLPGDAGDAFDVIAVLADKDAREAFASYHLHSRDTQEWVGMEDLPPGARRYDLVSVVRD